MTNQPATPRRIDPNDRAIGHRRNALQALDDPDGDGADVACLNAIVYALLAVEARLEEISDCVVR